MSTPRPHPFRALPSLVVLAASAGLALAGCTTKDTAGAVGPKPPTGDVAGYLATLPAWSSFSPAGPTQDSVQKSPLDTSEVTVPSVEEIQASGAVDTLTNVPFVCTSADYEWSRNPQQLIMYSPPADILWPGALIQGKSYKDGALLGLTIAERSPVNVSIPALPTGRNFLTVDTVDEAHVNAAIGQMVGDATSQDLAVGATATTFQMQTYHSEQSFALEMNASGRYLGFSAAAGGAVSQSTAETTVTVHFAQTMFEAVVAPPQTPGAFFSRAFTSDKLQEQVNAGKIGPDNLPVYVATVAYGRMMMFSMTSTASESDIKATLNISYHNAVGGGSLSLSPRQKEILQRATIRIASIGGNDSATSAMIRTGDWRQYFTQTAKLSTARPLSYTLKNLADGSVATVWETTQHKVQTCQPRSDIPGPFRFLPGQPVSVPVATPYTTLLADVNGDGRSDLVFNHLSAGSNDIAVALGQGNGSFAPPVTSSYAGPAPSPEGWTRYTLQAGDITGDGKADLVWSGVDHPDKVYTAVSDGSGGFTFPGLTQHFAVMQPGWTVSLADLDGDGAKDIVWNLLKNTGNFSYVGVSTRDGHFELHKYGVYENMACSGCDFSHYRLHVMDVNGDGREDLVWNILTDKTANRVYVAVWQPAGNFDFRAPQDVYTGSGWGPYQPLVGDFNGDRNADFAWIASATDRNDIHLGIGTGRGTFGSGYQDAGTSDKGTPGKGPFALYAGDVDGDGITDVIWDRIDSSGNRVAVTRGTRSGTFDLTEVAQAEPDAVNWLQATTLVGDVNGDHQDDVVWLIPGGTTRVYVGLAKKP